MFFEKYDAVNIATASFFFMALINQNMHRYFPQY